jgi:replicative superfamily II helicase
MSEEAEPQTLSHALLKLGKIRSVEDSITFGLIGFHRAKNRHELSTQESAEMKQHLKLFEEFCERFTKIAALAQEERAKTLESWLTEKRKEERTSRIGTYAGIRLVFPSSKEIQGKAPQFQLLCQMARKTLRGKAKEREIDKSLETLENIQQELSKRLAVEKRTTEKVISGRLPSIYHGTSR